MLLSTCLDIASEGTAAESLAAYEARVATIERVGPDIVLVGREIDGAIVPPRLEALLTLPWLAGRISNALLVGVIPALHAVPFHVARALSAIDFLNDGRTGWMPVWHRHAEIDRAYGPSYAVASDEIAPKHDDFIKATQALWDSWDGDALVIDKASGIYLDSDKVRRVDYRGPYFSTMGSLNAARPPQGHPVLVRDLVAGDEASTVRADITLLGGDTATVEREANRLKAEPGLVLVKTQIRGEETGMPLDRALALVADGIVDGIHLVGQPSESDLAAVRASAVRPAANGTARAALGLPTPVNPYTERAFA